MVRERLSDGMRKRKKAYICPRNLSDVKKLVVSSCDDSISGSTVLLLRLVFPNGEKTPCESRKGRWDIVILELVHLPALDRDLWYRRRGILDRLDEFGRFFVKRVEVGYEL
jgi:hypothetical protein